MPEQPKPRFEPPPWEEEAFERFRKAQEEARTQEALEAALRDVRSREVRPPSSPPGADPAIEAHVQAGPEAEAPGTSPAIPEARIDAMLIELRGEEPPAPSASKGLIYGTIAFMTVSGTYIIIRSGLLFGSVQAGSGVGMLLAGLLSFVVLLIGLGFLGGAFLLFRKYRQYL